MAVVVGVFESKERAEKAVRAMRERGMEQEISIVAKDDRGGRGGGEGGQGGDGGRGGEGRYGTEAAGEDFGGESIAEGTAWGGALGAIGGLLAGAGALAIPGIGPIVAAGPLAATLSGAVAGGVAGGLVDLGIPEERGRQLEEEVKKGKILCVVEADREKVDEAARIMREHGARDVETHGEGQTQENRH